MKTTDYMLLTLDRLPKGYVFTYKDFMDEVNKKEAVIKALNRLAASGKIVKIAKGKYYKPEETAFGVLEPDQKQIVKDLLEKNGKTTGYLTGFSTFNLLGLTTQVSNTIQIGKNETRPPLKRGRFIISFIKQKNIITKENIPLLQILDAIRYLKKIPDTSVGASCQRLSVIIKELPDQKQSSLVRLAKKYPPATRALLGAILEDEGMITLAKPLKKSLNPITKYQFPDIGKVLLSAKKWNIQ